VAGSAAIRELSHCGLLKKCAAALPAKIPMIQGAPESHLLSVKFPRYLSECLKRWLLIPMCKAQHTSFLNWEWHGPVPTGGRNWCDGLFHIRGILAICSV